MNLKNLLTIALATLLFACTKTDQNQVTITGEIINPIGDEVQFNTQVAPFLGDTIYSTTLNKDGTFAISFNLDSATYLNFGHGVEVTAMYVKPGDKIHLTIDTELFDETIKYQGSMYSSYLAERYLLEEGKNFYGKDYYMSSAEEYKEILNSFKISLINKVSKITDSTFVNNQIIKLEKNINSAVEQQKKLVDKNSAETRAYMWEARELGREFNFYAAIDSLNSTEFNQLLDKYTKTFQSLLNNVTDAEFIVDAKERIKKTTNSWLERKTATDKMPKEGEPAIDFNYPDTDGNEFSLASFKGNLVYVDVWATWCGPCKAEIPSLQQLEADYHGKNITFMSVSVDTDKEAWEKMVAEKELGGVQLWADGWSKITKDYAIFGIPRFMLFDAIGNVISTDAARPSSVDIRGILDANL
jgi:thiol-disulfide isomerase/thioredoxin